MRRVTLMSMFILLMLLVIASIWLFYFKERGANEAPKQQPLAVSKHSGNFNNAVDRMMNSYYTLTNAFVQWDSLSVDAGTGDLSQQLTALDIQELKKDTTGIFETAETFLNNARADVRTMQQEKLLVGKRHALNSLTENIFNFLRVVKYDRTKVYLQECPMAFNDVEPGLWLSKNPEIANPYLGLHHPRYGKGMLKCGETREMLNYTGGQ